MTDKEQTIEPTNAKHRRIKSFVLRTGRMTESQQNAYDEFWPSKGLTVGMAMLNYQQLFANNNPIVFEIGFGMGASLVEMAANSPDKNYIGVEVHTPGVGRLLHLMNEQGVKNLCVFNHDAVEVLEKNIPDNSLERIQIFFPDPWHKRKHNKRRLIKPEFVQALRQKLKTGGVIHMATDWEHYADQMMAVLSESQGFENQAGEQNYSERPNYRPLTKFEQRGQRLGHGVWDMLFEKIS
ncbi:MAG: tRNA (guanine-N7-)-methyltransferase [Pseudohongiellaceae bacterium]